MFLDIEDARRKRGSNSKYKCFALRQHKAESNTVYPLSVGADISGIIVELTTHQAHGSYISNNTHKAQNGTIITQSRRELVRTAHKTWYNRIAIHAGELFKEEIAKLAQDVADGEPSADGSIDMAVAAVWRIARRYQHEKRAKQVAEKQAEPTGTKK